MKTPNKLTESTLRKSENGKELNEVSSICELFAELEEIDKSSTKSLIVRT